MKSWAGLFIFLFCFNASAATPLGVPSPFASPQKASHVIPKKVLLERMPQGGDVRLPKIFLGDAKTGHVWELDPDGKVTALIHLKPWRSKSGTKKMPLAAWLSVIQKENE